MSAFFEELRKIAAEARDSNSPWAPKTIGAPRAKLTNAQFPKAPTAPSSMSPKLIQPVAKAGPTFNYSQPSVAAPSGTNPGQRDVALSATAAN